MVQVTKMTKEDYRQKGILIWSYIQRHAKGRDIAVSVKWLMNFFEMTDKQVRLVVRQLVMEGEPIGSGPGGYYEIVSQDDLERAANMRIRHAMGQLRAVNKLKNSSQVRASLGQLELLLGRAVAL